MQQRAVTIKLPATSRYHPVLETWREVPGDAGEPCPAQRFVMSQARPFELLRVMEALPADDNVLSHDDYDGEI